VTKGKPVKKVLNIMLVSWRSFNSRMGKIGSWAVLVFSRQSSQVMKRIHDSPDKVNVAMIGALFHGYWLPPDSRANTRRTDAARRERQPSISTRWVVSRENLARSRAEKVKLVSTLLAGRKMAIIRIATTPGGPLPVGTCQRRSLICIPVVHSLQQKHPSPAGVCRNSTTDKRPCDAREGKDR